MNAMPDTDALTRLHRLLDAGHLPEKARDYGAHLLRRLRAPVRLVVTGPPASGRSDLVRLLAGCPPRPVDAGTVGDTRETPSLVFRNLVVIEHGLAAPDSGNGGAMAIEATSPDIILWCTQGFTRDEAQVWARVPDNLKDHAFLVLTRADELARLGVLQDRLDDLCEVVETEFHSLLAIAERQAATALDGARITDPARHARSGAGALFDALQRMIEQGRSADLDAADLFVRRHGAPPSIPVGTPDAPAAADPPEPARPAAAAPDGPAPAVATDAAPDPGTDTGPICRDAAISTEAIRLLDELRDEFPDEIGADDPGEIGSLLSLCARTAEALGDIVSEDPDAPEDLTEDVLEAGEMMLLLGLEGDENAAADAVTLLLQLRRGFESRLCA